MRSVVVLGTDDRPTKHWRVAVTGSMAAPIRQSLRGVGVLTGAARVVRDPRIAGMLRAGPRVMDFLVRSHRRTTRIDGDDSIVAVRPTPALAAQAYVDELLIAALRHPDLYPVRRTMRPRPPTCRRLGSSSMTGDGSSGLPTTTGTLRFPTTSGLLTSESWDSVTSTRRSRAGGSPIPRSRAGLGGSSTWPTAPRTPGSPGRRDGTVGRGSSACTGLGWGRRRHLTCGRFGRPNSIGWASMWPSPSSRCTDRGRRDGCGART